MDLKVKEIKKGEYSPNQHTFCGLIIIILI